MSNLSIKAYNWEFETEIQTKLNIFIKHICIFDPRIGFKNIRCHVFTRTVPGGLKDSVIIKQGAWHPMLLVLSHFFYSTLIEVPVYLLLVSSLFVGPKCVK